MSITIPTGVTFTFETTFRISARSVCVTCVVTCDAFLDIDTFSSSIVTKASFTSAAKAAS